MIIDTIHGKMEDSMLEKRTGLDSDHRADINWVEYWLDGELVHRSAHVALKRTEATEVFAGVIG